MADFNANDPFNEGTEDSDDVIFNPPRTPKRSWELLEKLDSNPKGSHDMTPEIMISMLHKLEDIAKILERMDKREKNR